jgi:hypothetical protein
MARQREGKFKAEAKKIISDRYPGCFMHEMKCGDQGIPDTLVLYGEYWALLEFKESEDAPHRPNQDYYVDMFDHMGFSAFVYPENLDAVLRDLDHWFAT